MPPLAGEYDMPLCRWCHGKNGGGEDGGERKGGGMTRRTCAVQREAIGQLLNNALDGFGVHLFKPAQDGS